MSKDHLTSDEPMPHLDTCQRKYGLAVCTCGAAQIAEAVPSKDINTEPLLTRLRSPRPRPGYPDPLPAHPWMVEAADEIERLTLDGIHSCHDQCQRIACVQRREIERLLGICRYVTAQLDPIVGEGNNKPMEALARSVVREIERLTLELASYDAECSKLSKSWNDAERECDRLRAALERIANDGDLAADPWQFARETLAMPAPTPAGTEPDKRSAGHRIRAELAKAPDGTGWIASNSRIGRTLHFSTLDGWEVHEVARPAPEPADDLKLCIHVNQQKSQHSPGMICSDCGATLPT